MKSKTSTIESIKPAKMPPPTLSRLRRPMVKFTKSDTTNSSNQFAEPNTKFASSNRRFASMQGRSLMNIQRAEVYFSADDAAYKMRM